jgi:hypothetical protein
MIACSPVHVFRSQWRYGASRRILIAEDFYQKKSRNPTFIRPSSCVSYPQFLLLNYREILEYEK